MHSNLREIMFRVIPHLNHHSYDSVLRCYWKTGIIFCGLTVYVHILL